MGHQLGARHLAVDPNPTTDFGELEGVADQVVDHLTHPQAIGVNLSHRAGGVDLEIDLLARTAKRAGTEIVLQPREFKLLEYLMRNAERVVSKNMIMVEKRNNSNIYTTRL